MTKNSLSPPSGEVGLVEGDLAECALGVVVCSGWCVRRFLDEERSDICVR